MKFSCLVLANLLRVLLEKLIVTQIVKNFPAFYGTQRFITVFTRACHWSLFSAKWIQSTHSQPISLKSILMLSLYLCLGLLRGLFPLGFPTKILCTFLIFAMHAIWPSQLILLFHHPNNKWWSAHGMKLLSVQPLPVFCHLLPLRSTYSPQHPFMLTKCNEVFLGD